MSCPEVPQAPRESGSRPQPPCPRSIVKWGSPRTHHVWLHFRPRSITRGKEVGTGDCSPHIPLPKSDGKRGPTNASFKRSSKSCFNIFLSPSFLEFFQTCPTNLGCLNPQHRTTQASSTQHTPEHPSYMSGPMPQATRDMGMDDAPSNCPGAPCLTEGGGRRGLLAASFQRK